MGDYRIANHDPYKVNQKILGKRVFHQIDEISKVTKTLKNITLVIAVS